MKNARLKENRRDLPAGPARNRRPDLGQRPGGPFEGRRSGCLRRDGADARWPDALGGATLPERREAARDAVQDAFLSAFRGIQRFDGQAQLSTWLHRIVVNAALMRIRSRQRRPEQSIEPMLPVFAEDGHHITTVVSWTEPGEHVLERKQTRALVRAAIADLPESYRAVLLLRDIEKLSTKEAADQVGISENALKLRLHRARQALATVSAPRGGASSSWGRSAGSARIPAGR